MDVVKIRRKIINNAGLTPEQRDYLVALLKKVVEATKTPLPEGSNAAPGYAGWQPIVSAPKDRLVDVWTGKRRIADCYWDHICTEWRSTGNHGRLFMFKVATHWMEIPEPPKA